MATLIEDLGTVCVGVSSGHPVPGVQSPQKLVCQGGELEREIWTAIDTLNVVLLSAGGNHKVR